LSSVVMCCLALFSAELSGTSRYLSHSLFTFRAAAGSDHTRPDHTRPKHTSHQLSPFCILVLLSCSLPFRHVVLSSVLFPSSLFSSLLSSSLLL
jgi:hypothetical protein